ncbi:hypothetical protein QOZ80_6BG0472520 [Eleusine coracana subsp. coracana]|nr:hypothetical protein QOZ80_6BG0472520 [Eleusine coracana subsp. coracana]
MDLSRRRGTSGFRFLRTKVTEMKRNMEQNGGAIPARSVSYALAESFTSSRERAGKIGVLPKQVKTWFHNRHYYRQQPRIITRKSQANGKVMPLFGDQKHAAGSSLIAQPSAALHTGSAPGTNPTKDTKSSYEAKSAKDGAWYDVDTILSQRTLESGDLV